MPFADISTTTKKPVSDRLFSVMNLSVPAIPVPADCRQQAWWPEVAIIRCTGINGTPKIQLPEDIADFEAEIPVDDLQDLLIADFSGAKGVHKNADWFRLANGIGNLYLALIGQTRCHNVLRNPPGIVGR